MGPRDLISEAHWELTRLLNRLHVTGGTRDGQILLEPRIFLTLDFGDMFWSPGSVRKDINIGSGAQQWATVPDGKRWLLKHVMKGATTNAVGVYIVTGYPESPVKIRIVEPATGGTHWDGALKMEQAWGVEFQQGGVGDTSIEAQCLFEETDAF